MSRGPYRRRDGLPRQHGLSGAGRVRSSRRPGRTESDLIAALIEGDDVDPALSEGLAAYADWMIRTGARTEGPYKP
jgi:hypothetical protein